MRVNGAGTDDELFRYLPVGQSLCYQPQHLHLPSREHGRIGRCFSERSYYSSFRALVERCVQISCLKSLLWSHHPSLAPCGGKGFLTKMYADSSHSSLIACTFDRWHGSANRVT